MFNAFLTVLSLGALSLCLGRNAWAQQPVGTITQLQGTAQVQRTGDTLSGALTMLIEFHDQVRTAANSTVTITLVGNELLPEVCSGQQGEGCLLLSPSSTLVLDQAALASMVRLLTGSVRSGVAKQRATKKDFFIQTANALVRTFGTDFDVTYIAGVVRPGYGGCQRYTDVAVREGVVAVNNLANPGAVIEVPAGYETIVACLQPPITPIRPANVLPPAICVRKQLSALQ